MLCFYLPNTFFLIVFLDAFSFYTLHQVRCNMKITNWRKFALSYLMLMNKGSLHIFVTLFGEVMV